MSNRTLTSSSRRIGDHLLQAELITEAQLQEALTRQSATGALLGDTLVELGYLHQHDLIRILCEDVGIAYLTAPELRPDPAALGGVPRALARGHGVLPLREEAGRLVVAMANPFDIAAVTAVERAVGRPVKVLGAPRDLLALRISEAYEESAGSIAVPPGAPAHTPPPAPRRVTTPSRMETPAEDASAAQVCDEIIRRGIALGATDIHIEPQPEVTRLRYRLDGLLQDGGALAASVHPALMTRLKILSALNIAETRLPQDGRFRFRAEGREIDFRISTYPTLHGEDVVLRILDRGRVPLNLDELGIGQQDVDLLRSAMSRPHGLIAVTGPTGSGKTTTLYAALTEMNSGTRCILTLEDPIEYELDGIRQAQVNMKAGLTFGSGLRSMLRHDPDVILVGEMRDQETVEIALSAALTGHLVLTTLHTNTAAGAIPRLLDMGAEAYLLASAIQLIASQRLVRKLCRECRAVAHVAENVRERFRLEDVRVYEPRGCAACRHTGFRGRIAIFEVLSVTEEMAQRVLEGSTEEELRRLSGRPSLLEDGLTKVRAGVTSLEELLRVIAV